MPFHVKPRRKRVSSKLHEECHARTGKSKECGNSHLICSACQNNTRRAAKRRRVER